MIETINLKDNDIVLIRLECPFDKETKERIEKHWESLFLEKGYKNIKVIVLDKNIGLNVISPYGE